GLEETEVLITYAPRDTGRDAGDLIVVSNSSTGQRTDIPIQTTFSGTELVIAPTPLEFVSLDGAPVSQSTRVTSLGTVPVTITGLFLSDDTDPEFSIATDTVNLPQLARGEFFDIEVVYTPEGGDSDLGTLVIQTDADNDAYREIEVPLAANQPTPEIVVSPPNISFGAVELNVETPQEVIAIENLGNAPLVIDRIALALAPPPTNDMYHLYDLPELPATLDPDAVLRFHVSYQPTEEGSHNTAVVIASNDPDEPMVNVPLSGRVRQPCIQVLPGSVDFGLVALDIESAHAQMQVINCGDLPVTVNEITIDDPGFDWAPVDAAMARADVELLPLSTMPIEVWYTNNGLPEGQRLDATLTVDNTSNEHPRIDVPLRVTGGGAPTCEVRLLPRRMDFGLVARGRNVTRELTMLNTGTGHCEIRNQTIEPPLMIPIPLPGFNEVRFILTGPAPNGRLGPGAEEPIEVTYRPNAFIGDSGKLVVTYWDPFRMEERRAEADLSGIGGESNIEVIPERLDFGRVTAGECASREERVTVYNTGIVNLCITDVHLDGDACDEFLIVDRPIADGDGCIIVTRASPAEVRLVYEPTNLGRDECDLVFDSDANDTPSLRVALVGEGIRERHQTDVFEQTSGRTVDVLFVVDNSGSMGEEQDNMRNNFARFIAGAQAFQNDYQLGIVTTDMDAATDQGRLQGEPRIMRRGPQVENQFADTVRVGTNGAGEEKGLEAAQKALSNPLAFDTGVACRADGDCVQPDACVEGFCGGYNRGFVREEAALEVVFVSDEDDFSSGALNFYVDFFKNIKGFRNEGRFHAHAIVGAENGQAHNCSSADGDASAGDRYVEVARQTHGGIYSICSNNFGVPLQQIGNQAFGLQVQFFLSRPAVRASVQVAVDGMRRNDGWDYDDPSNSVVFGEATVPQAGQTIQVDYEAQCFERRGG
ncbi:MAG: choice-of-anchor D domain-containing protein, partial [Myxococcales bacterium]|nr:choice-of-anchor D domain-containing protein [Myxococcales bacterium]